MSIGNASELVGKCNVHVAIGCLGKFCHLRSLERLHLCDRRIEHALVEGGGTRQAGGVGAANELRIRGEVAEGLTSQHPLRREAAEHLRATFGGNLCNQFTGGADRHGGFKNYKQVVVCAGDQCFGSANERLVGDAPIVANEYRHNDKCNVGIAHGGRAVDGGTESA